MKPRRTGIQGFEKKILRNQVRVLSAHRVTVPQIRSKVPFTDNDWFTEPEREWLCSCWCWLDILGFFLNFCWTHVHFFGPLIPLFRTSGNVSSGFQSQSGQPYSSMAEAYVLHLGLLLVLLLGHSARLLFGRTCNLYKEEPSLLLFLWVSVDERFLFIFTFFLIIAQGK